MFAGFVFSLLLFSSNIGTLPVTPFPETPAGQFSNALYFVVLIAIAATIFYVLIKYRSRKMIAALIGFAMTAASVLLSVFYSIALFGSFPNWEIYVAIVAVAVTIIFDYVVFKGNETSRNVIVVLLGGALGVFLGWSIPVVSALLILAFLAVYDIIAVYKGPVGKIASSGLDQLKGLSFSFKDIQMGLGDLVFYSMLCAVMLLNSDFGGIAPYVGSLFGVVGGSFITFRILEKRGIFPGLPVPIFLGIIGGLLGAFVITF